MAVTRREFLSALTAVSATATLAACGGRQATAPETAATTEAAAVDLSEFKALALDMGAWHYDAEHEVWWQLGLSYCTKPASSTYEKLAIYVPGAYLKPTDEKADLSGADSSKTFSVEVDAEASVGQFTAATAPIVMPVNAPDFTAQAAPAAYLHDGLDPYLKAGLVYVYAGCRGRSNGYDSSSKGEGFFSGGAPWGVVDLKAAVRYLRYNAGVLPGSVERLVVFGHASGGLLAAVLGASGDSALYDPYLAKIGAATHDAQGNAVGDAVSAAMCWCPDPAANMADAAYEWGVGQFGTGDTRAEGTWTKLASEDLAAGYAEYVNGLALADDSGTQLALDQTDGGTFTGGSYYEHLLATVEQSAAAFLTQTGFPHTFESLDIASGAFPGSGTKAIEVTPVPDATANRTPAAATTEAATAAATGAAGAAATRDAAEDVATGGDGATPAATTSVSEGDVDAANESVAEAAQVTGMTPKVLAPPVTYASRGDYVGALNAQGRWLTFNETRGTVRIAGLAGYVNACRTPIAGVLSFDTTDRSSSMNQLFGNDEEDSLHFSQDVADVLSSRSDAYAQATGWDSKLPGDWAADLAKTDALETSIDVRRNMYDPLYFVSGAAEGFGSAKVAAHWRINVGMSQPSVPLSSSVNLALALKRYDGVADVAFTPVWGQGRVLAEVGTADAAGAFVGWLGTLFPAGQDAAQTEGQPATTQQ